MEIKCKECEIELEDLDAFVVHQSEHCTTKVVSAAIEGLGFPLGWANNIATNFAYATLSDNLIETELIIKGNHSSFSINHSKTDDLISVLNSLDEVKNTIRYLSSVLDPEDPLKILYQDLIRKLTI